MIIQIEHYIEFYLTAKVYDETLSEFNLILNNLYKARSHSFANALYDDRSQCIEAMKGHYKHFQIGWGAAHMWVHQKIDGKVLPHRLLIVLF